MVRGLRRFREHFRGYEGSYSLIGGAACDLLLSEAGLEFRATKDLDIVLCVEAIDARFVNRFWEFVRAGRYQAQQSEAGRRRYYRFLKPEDDDYPFMLELLSRRPDILHLAGHSHLAPIPIGEDVSSLSAILLSDVYYGFLHSGKVLIDGVPIVRAEHLIPLKARAWLDLTARRSAGERVQQGDITKHKNDVFRLYRVIEPTAEIRLPGGVREDLSAFLGAMRSEGVDLTSLGIRSQSLEDVLAELQRVYLKD